MTRGMQQSWGGIALCAVTLGAALGVTGCRPPVPPYATFLEGDFTDTKDTYSAADDIAVADAGLQIALTIHTFDSATQAPVTANTADLVVTRSSDINQFRAYSGTITPGGATFPQVTLFDGSNDLQVTVFADGYVSPKTIRRTVTALASGPTITGFSFQNDANADRVLTAVEQPTGPVVAVITTTSIAVGGNVVVEDADTGTQYGTAAVDAASPTSTAVTLSNLPVTDTTDATFHLLAVATDEAGHPSDASDPNAIATLRVARAVPTLTLLSPCGGSAPCATPATVGVEDDADTSAAGFQLAVRVQVTGAVSTVTFTEQAGSVTPGAVVQATPDASGIATATFAAPAVTASAHYVLQVTAQDSAGNAGVPLAVDLTVPAFVSTAQVAGGCPDSRCGPTTVADLMTAPSVTFIAPSNSHLYPVPAAGYVVDKNPATPTAEADFTFTVAGARNAQVQLEVAGALVGTPISPGFTDNGPHTVVLPDAPLAQRTSTPVGVRIFAAGGGQAHWVSAATTFVDVVPPAQTVTAVTVSAGAGGGVFAPRQPTLQVTWGTAGDDGTAGGAVVGYDARWSDDALIPPGNSASSGAPVWTPIGIDSDQKFFNLVPSQVAYSATGGALGTLLPASATTLPAPLTVPPVGTYYAVVRGVDAVGNFAPLPALAQQSATDKLGSKTLSSATPSSYLFGGNMVAGDLDGDGFDDLVITESAPQSGAVPSPLVLKVWIAKGAADPQSMTSSLLVVPTSTVDTNLSVSETTTGFLSRVKTATPACKDLVISGGGWASNRGRAVLYFCGTGAPNLVTPGHVEIRGTAATTGRLGLSMRAIPDINGDGYDELLLSAPVLNARQGAVYLFYGRAAASWSALATSTEGASEAFIPLSAADRVFPGPTAGARLLDVPAGQKSGTTTTDFLVKAAGSSVVTVNTLGTPFALGAPLTVTSTDPGFASGTFTVATVSAGTFTYDDGQASASAISNGTGEVKLRGPVQATANPAAGAFGRRKAFSVVNGMLTIPESIDYLNSLFEYVTADVNAAGAGSQQLPTEVATLPESMSPKLATGSTEGFGFDSTVGRFTQAAPGDLAVGFPLKSEVFVYANAGAPLSALTPFAIAGNGKFGNQLASLDFDGDGRDDLLVGNNNLASGPAGTGGGSNFLTGGALLLGGGPAGAELDRVFGAGIRHSRVLGDAASLPALNWIGLSVATGDFNGDGAPDIAVSDPLASNGAAMSGRVFLRY